MIKAYNNKKELHRTIGEKGEGSSIRQSGFREDELVGGETKMMHK